MTLDDLFSCGFDLNDIDRLGEMLALDNTTLDDASTTLGKSLASTLTAAKVIAKDVLGNELDVVAPQFAESAEAFLAERAEWIREERERRRVQKALAAVEEDLALYAWERSQAAAAAIA